MKYEKNKKVIIIGNSPSILEKEYGDIIDGFDTVIRINRCVTEGFEQFIGSKTSIWATSSWCLEKNPDNLESESSKLNLPYFFPPNIKDLTSIWYRTPRTRDDFIRDYSKLYKEIENKDNYYIMWKTQEFYNNFSEFCNSKDEEFHQIIKSSPKKKEQIKKKNPLEFVLKNSKSDFDTGLMAILTSTLFFDNITLYGFDFYSEKNSGQPQGNITGYYRESEKDENGTHPEDVAWRRANTEGSYATAFINEESTIERKSIIQTLVDRNQVKILK